MISDGVAYTVTQILEQNVDYGTGTGADYGHPAAGKTGTTEEHSDAWFCGYTPRLGTTVWVGYPRGKIPMESVHGISVSGGSFPAQIWRLFMSSAIGQLEPEDFPEPKDYPEWEDFERGQYARSFGYYQDDDYTPPATTETTETTATEPTDSLPDAPPASRPRAAAEAGSDDAVGDAARLAAADAPGRAGDAGAHRARAALSRAALLAAGAVAVLVAGCVACAWVEGAPLVPADGGRADGGSLGTLFLVLLVLAFAAYLAALALLRRGRSVLRAVLIGAVVIQLIPLAGPLLVSTDAWTYWEYGRIAAIHDGDPYVDTPNEFPDDPAYDKAGADWRDTTSVYGPAFTLLSEVVALVSGSSAAAAAWIFKVLAALGVLACTFLAARLSREQAYAAALVGWNPLFAIHFAGGGHNDSILIALTLAALTLAAAGRRQWAGAAWALAGADQVGAARLLRPARGCRAGRAGAVSATSASPWPRRRSSGSRPGATASTGCAPSGRSRATRRSSRAMRCRTGSSSSASRTTSRSCSPPPRSWPGSPGSRARRPAAVSGSASQAVSCSRRRPG